MKIVRILAILVVLGLAGLVGFLAYAWRSEIGPITPPGQQAFGPDFVRHGADLAAVGNCISCHTARGGRAFAGGLPLETPFGTIYSTNITPDADTGIGRWSEAAFRRAMKEGVDREGRHLYPAFPYDHFTKVADEDIRALYAFLMTREAVNAPAKANKLPFPFNIRLAIAGWKLLFFKRGDFRPDPALSEAENRGAYLVEGLAHCGSCHTPRNVLGAEKSDKFAGGEAEGWTAYALNAAAPAPVPWDADALRVYLRQGWHDRHGMARGPMTEVIDNLAAAPDTDIAAIAAYVAKVAGPPSVARHRAADEILARTSKERPATIPATADGQTVPPAGDAGVPGAAIYQVACASCHESGRGLPFGGVNLALSTGPSGPPTAN